MHPSKVANSAGLDGYINLTHSATLPPNPIKSPDTIQHKFFRLEGL